MCDAVLPSAYRERVVKARLPHTCYSCGYPIMPGEHYEHASGIWDGSADDYRRHLLCSLLDRQAGECGCWEFGGLQDAQGRRDLSWVYRRAWETVTRRSWGTEPRDAGSISTGEPDAEDDVLCFVEARP